MTMLLNKYPRVSNFYYSTIPLSIVLRNTRANILQVSKYPNTRAMLGRGGAAVAEKKNEILKYPVQLFQECSGCPDTSYASVFFSAPPLAGYVYTAAGIGMICICHRLAGRLDSKSQNHKDKIRTQLMYYMYDMHVWYVGKQTIFPESKVFCCTISNIYLCIGLRIRKKMWRINKAPFRGKLRNWD